MFLLTSTSPDPAYTVSFLSQFNPCYSTDNWKSAKRILRYLKGTMDLCITYKRTKKELFGVADVDWAGDRGDHCSYTGFVFILTGAAISWESRKQRTVALSSTEAEYIALSESTKEAQYLQGILQQIGVNSEYVN